MFRPRLPRPEELPVGTAQYGPSVGHKNKCHNKRTERRDGCVSGRSRLLQNHEVKSSKQQELHRGRINEIEEELAPEHPSEKTEKPTSEPRRYGFPSWFKKGKEKKKEKESAPEPAFLKILFEKLHYRIVTQGRVNDFYEAAFQDAIDDGQKLYAVDVGDYKCIEIDTAEDIKNAEKMIAKYIDKN